MCNVKDWLNTCEFIEKLVDLEIDNNLKSICKISVVTSYLKEDYLKYLHITYSQKLLMLNDSLRFYDSDEHTYSTHWLGQQWFFAVHSQDEFGLIQQQIQSKTAETENTYIPPRLWSNYARNTIISFHAVSTSLFSINIHYNMIYQIFIGCFINQSKV